VDLDCQDFVEIVTEYLEGTLSDDERQLLEEHLLECEDCVEYLAQMRVTQDLSGKLELQHADAAIREKLLNVFRMWRSAL